MSAPTFALAASRKGHAGRIAADLLRAVAEAIPFNIHGVLTDDGVQFIHDLPDRSTPEEEAAIDACWAARGEPRISLVHAFDQACTQLGIEHRTTTPHHPCTNGQVERMNRTIREAAVRRYHHGTHDELRAHLQPFVDAYTYGRRLKAIRGFSSMKPSARTGPNSQSASRSTLQTTP